MEANPKNIFSADNFPPVTQAAWKAQILKDVKTATDEEKQRMYNEQMIWQPYEGFPVEPFYTFEKAQNLNVAALKGAPGWRVREWIPVTSETTANGQARDALAMGADEIAFEITHEPVNVPALMHEITAPVRLYVSQPASLPGLPPNGTVVYAPSIETVGFQFPTLDPYRASLQSPLSNLQASTSQFAIRTSHFNDSGASAGQELAFGLNALVEYAHWLTEQNVPPETIFQSVECSFAMRTSFLMEIAKLRAWRLLFRQVADAYGVANAVCRVHAQTTQWSKATDEPANNLIRATIEAMAAVIGGCDALTVLPYNGDANDASVRRVSRNVSIIIREEGFLDKVTDIAAGSYYVDQLTVQLAGHAWKLFQTVEQQGGFLRAMESGFIAGEIEKVRQRREADV